MIARTRAPGRGLDIRRRSLAISGDVVAAVRHECMTHLPLEIKEN
jgi:hypothetical protein